MDAISYSHADKQKQRIQRFIANPDTNSGFLTFPLSVEESNVITIPASRVSYHHNLLIQGELHIEGELFIIGGAGTSSIGG